MGLFGRRKDGGRGKHTDPVCGMVIAEAQAVGPDTIRGQTYWFCSADCQDQYREQHTGQRRSRRDQAKARKERKQKVMH